MLKNGGDATAGTLRRKSGVTIIEGELHMAQVPLQWHPAFCSSLQIELEGEPLEFVNEFNLTRKPLQIDVLVIKKIAARTVQKSIGKLFRTHNIVEFKSPDDTLSINDFYKVLGYACIYQANTKTVMKIRPDEITMSFVCNQFPRKMVKWLKQMYGSQIEQKYPGIFYLSRLPFSTQIIVLKKISKEEHKWLSRLRPGLNAKSDLNVLAEEYKDKYSNPLYAACMDVILRANKNVYERHSKEGTNMCQALTELVYEWYGDEIEEARAETRLLTVIEQIQRKVMKNKSSDQIAEELEWDRGFVDQICQVIRDLSVEATNDSILNKWKEQFVMG